MLLILSALMNVQPVTDVYETDCVVKLLHYQNTPNAVFERDSSYAKDSF